MSQKKGKRRSLLPTRKSHPTDVEDTRRKGGNIHFLAKHRLDEHSHPMDWFNALMPLAPKHNLEIP